MVEEGETFTSAQSPPVTARLYALAPSSLFTIVIGNNAPPFPGVTASSCELTVMTVEGSAGLLALPDEPEFEPVPLDEPLDEPPTTLMSRTAVI